MHRGTVADATLVRSVRGRARAPRQGRVPRLSNQLIEYQNQYEYKYTYEYVWHRAKEVTRRDYLKSCDAIEAAHVENTNNTFIIQEDYTNNSRKNTHVK